MATWWRFKEWAWNYRVGKSRCSSHRWLPSSQPSGRVEKRLLVIPDFLWLIEMVILRC